MYYTGPYIDQHPDALRLSVVEGPVDFTQLTALDARSISAGTLSVRATIIGASHVLTITHRDVPEWSEVLACIELPDIQGWVLDDLRRPIRQAHGPIQYRFEMSRIAWPSAASEPDELRTLVERANHAGCRSTGFMVEFPHGGCTVTPKTVIAMEALPNGRQIKIDTAHSYPSVLRTVLSTTTLTY